jgi:antirestriction protein ArdC
VVELRILYSLVQGTFPFVEPWGGMGLKTTRTPALRSRRSLTNVSTQINITNSAIFSKTGHIYIERPNSRDLDQKL